jgi:cellulose synthase/poly-beta-1,6-N-acetylglucosamine synthase-like glycosyltransferase
MKIDVFVYFLIFFGLFNIAMIISFWLERPKHKKPYTINQNLPVVSIVVPAYNEEKVIAKTLKNLLKLNYPKEKLDIIVVDDGSKDKTYEIAKKFVKYGIRVFTKPNGGKASAVNYGIRKARGKLIATLDADSFPEKDCLLKLLPYLEDRDVMAVTSSITVKNPKNFWERLQYAEYLFGIFLRNAFAIKNALYVTPGPMSIYKKTFFEKHGLFEEGNITEDNEMGLRIQKYNYRIENAIDAKVSTIAPSNFKSLFRQRVRWYRGFLDNSIRYRKLFNMFEYGFLALILFFAYISVIVVFGYIGYIAFKNITFFADWIHKISLVGFSLFKPSSLTAYQIKEFVISNLTNPIIIFGMLGIMITLSILMLTKRFSKIEEGIFLNSIIYIAFYGLIYWIFWAAVLISKVFGIKIGW